VNKSFWNAVNDVGIEEVFIIALVEERYAIKKNGYVSSLTEFIKYMKDR
jgi:hypothetical protein